MTCVVFSRKHMQLVADSQLSDDSSVATVNKIETISKGKYKGWYFTYSGCMESVAEARDWAHAGFAPNAKPEFKGLRGKDHNDYKFDILLVRPDGECTMYLGCDLTPMELLDRFIGLGSGSAYAIGALESGKKPEWAVKMACRRDPHTGEPVRVVQLGVDKR